MNENVTATLGADGRPSWFEFRIQEVEAGGVEASKLAALLQEIASTFTAAAKLRLGRVGRGGRPTVRQQALSAVRILAVTPGSLVVEVAPPAEGAQSALEISEDASVDDVASELLMEARVVASGARPEPGRGELHREVTALLTRAQTIGEVTELVHRPTERDTGRAQPPEDRVRISMPVRAERTESPVSQERRRRLVGHAYMVDVEPGRYKLRVKTPDGRNIILEASEELTQHLKAAVDRAVEVESIEAAGEGIPTRWSAIGVSILPRSGEHTDIPPKSVQELAEEQGVLGALPNYGELASQVWRTASEIEAFDEYLRAVRASGAA